ncbi:MAG: acyl carrier protein [Candidatus Nitrosopelagicus sp.]|nr:acyl carrier protein [Candidatus Nitrosopelagicus sp.]
MTNLEHDIQMIFLDTFPDMQKEDFNLDKKQEDYDNWDSFAHLNLITMTESKFDITLSIDETTSIVSARDLLDCVKLHL